MICHVFFCFWSSVQDDEFKVGKSDSLKPGSVSRSVSTDVLAISVLGTEVSDDKETADEDADEAEAMMANAKHIAFILFLSFRLSHQSLEPPAETLVTVALTNG